ncbi:MAG TPA: hypothetical protein VFX51_11305, partial [Solirubrobacteraceae bacterium]|nr:hypothetical protein [Solirubrobacteraceae bacterium]
MITTLRPSLIRTAEQRVDAGAAVERVVADAGEDRVAGAEAANHVRTRTGGDGVGLAAEDVLDAR